MAKCVVFNFSNEKYVEKYEITEQEEFNEETLEFELKAIKKPAALTDEEITAAKSDKNYKMASVLVDIITKLGGACSLDLNKISFILPDENVQVIE